MASSQKNEVKKDKSTFEDALEISGFGLYNYTMLLVCCVLILSMYVDIFGFSVLLPSVSCDMDLTVAQQGLLSAVPLVGIMIYSYVWGLCADTLGRRKTLLIAMPIAVTFNLGASMAPNFTSLCILKFLSAGFSSSANAAAFVLLGETVPQQKRSRFMFLMASATMLGHVTISLPALPINGLKFTIEVPFLGLDYRPWRLVMQVLSLPALMGITVLIFLQESPKFLLSNGQEHRALDVLQTMYSFNTKMEKNSYPVKTLYLEEADVKKSSEGSFLKQMWNQTAPLFKPPLLKNSLKLYFILMCAYMTSTGFAMWVPTVTNEYFNGEDTTGKTLCEVAAQIATRRVVTNSTMTRNCDEVVQPMTLYTAMVYSALGGFLNILLTFIVGPLGKKKTTLMVITICEVCGVVLLFVRSPMLSILLFFMFLYVALILGNMNTYLVELNPTYLRGMATCLSVVVARGFGFVSVQLIAMFLSQHCVPLISAYIVLILLGFITAFFLPPDTQKPKHATEIPHE